MTANPSSAADFCQYSISFNRRFPDYPKLGDTSNLLLIGANAFDRVTGSFLDSDLYSVAKPPPGTTCPAASTLTGDKEFNLKNANGKTAFTPVPANQTDTDTTGYVVACPASIPRKGATFLSLYDVSENPDGTMNASSARNVSVDKYKVPANAPQPGTTNKLDALDARLTQAVSATDPAHGNVAIWTQHTIFGGGPVPGYGGTRSTCRMPLCSRAGTSPASRRAIRNATFSTE